MHQQALILFAHGARDARWAQPFERLQLLLQQARPELAVHLAFLEFMQPDLPAAVEKLMAQNIYRITLVPVFLAQGGHVLRDLPAMLAELQTRYPELQIRQAGAIGEDDAVLQAIASYCLACVAA